MTAIDWSSKPEPWCWIGPQFRRVCEQIAAAPTPRSQAVAEEVKRRRLALGLTQVELAVAAGYQPGSILFSVRAVEHGNGFETQHVRLLEALDRLEAARERTAA